MITMYVTLGNVVPALCEGLVAVLVRYADSLNVLTGNMVITEHAHGASEGGLLWLDETCTWGIHLY